MKAIEFIRASGHRRSCLDNGRDFLCTCGYNLAINEIKQLEAKIEGAKGAMQIHAGDICSANNEADCFIEANKELEDENTKLQADNKLLKKAIEGFGDNPAGFDWAVLNRIEELEKVLEGIVEYWNKDNNPGAMEDALWHIIEVAGQVLEGEQNDS